MHMEGTKTGTGRFIVRSDDAATLAAFLQSVQNDPGMTLVDVIGPAGQPHTAVVDMSEDKAHSLEQQFRDAKSRITIEPDRPLSLFGGQAQA
jgi:rRNA processing protein Gar1